MGNDGQAFDATVVEAASGPCPTHREHVRAQHPPAPSPEISVAFTACTAVSQRAFGIQRAGAIDILVRHTIHALVRSLGCRGPRGPPGQPR